MYLYSKKKPNQFSKNEDLFDSCTFENYIHYSEFKEKAATKSN